MSAYVVSTKHIDAILTFIHRTSPREGGIYLGVPGQGVELVDCKRPAGLTKIGGLLMNTNIESVNTRYRLDDLNEPYQYTAYAPFLVASAEQMSIITIKLCHCLAYQSCELNNWEKLPARAVLEQIKDRACHYLPGYDAAPWSLD